jgi:hypothetical protein
MDGATSACSIKRSERRWRKPKPMRMTLTKAESERAEIIAKGMSWREQIHASIVTWHESKIKRRRNGSNDLTCYDMGLSEEDLQRWKECFE